jgi:hypothetical protein
MRNEQPIGPTKRILKRLRPIEIDSGDADTLGGTFGQLNRVGPPGQHGDIDRIGSEEAGQRQPTRPVAPAMAIRGLCDAGWIFLDMSKLPLYLGTISPRYMERSFQDVKWGVYERQAAIR